MKWRKKKHELPNRICTVSDFVQNWMYVGLNYTYRITYMHCAVWNVKYKL